MRHYTFIIVLGILFMASCVIYLPPPQEEQPYEYETSAYSEDMDVSFFYEHLSPHGIWVEYLPYGYVWLPHSVPSGWRPYTFGRWLLTDYGWTWASEFTWGWIPFHYGRWGWDRHIGWYWKPGFVWGPAWVTWRRGVSYLGWAPLPPDVPFVAGFGITTTSFTVMSSHWVFVDGRYFYNTRLYSYILPVERNLTIVTLTTQKTYIIVQDQRVINKGVDTDDVQRISRQRITKYSIEKATKAQQTRVYANKLQLHRPDVKQNERVKPRQVLSKDEAQVKITQIRSQKRDSLILDLNKLQERERKLLQQSQEKEIQEMEKKYQTDRSRVRRSAGSEKLEQEYKAKAASLKEKHEQERTKISERHKVEKDQMKKQTEDDKKTTEKQKTSKKKVKKEN